MVRLRALAMISCFLTNIFWGTVSPNILKFSDYDALAIIFTINYQFENQWCNTYLKHMSVTYLEPV